MYTGEQHARQTHQTIPRSPRTIAPADNVLSPTAVNSDGHEHATTDVAECLSQKRMQHHTTMHHPIPHRTTPRYADAPPRPAPPHHMI